MWSVIFTFKNKFSWRLSLAFCRHYLFDKQFVTEVQWIMGYVGWDGQWSLRWAGVEGHICQPHLEEPWNWDSLETTEDANGTQVKQEAMVKIKQEMRQHKEEQKVT